MNTMEIIMTRKSFRTFNGKKISEEDKNKLLSYTSTIDNPYNIPVDFVFLDGEEFDLSSPVIEGEDFYIAAKVPRVEHCEEAYGYSFEKMVLYAWSLGIGTTWIGGTLDREVFERAASTGDDEYMMIVTPVGYPSDNRTKVDVELRNTVKGDERLSKSQLFFEGDFSKPLDCDDDWIEAVRWAPSAANRQPWRIVKDQNMYHFFLEHSKGYSSNVGWDVQKIDIGIAICHFMCVMKGTLTVKEPSVDTDEYKEYIATAYCEDL